MSMFATPMLFEKNPGTTRPIREAPFRMESCDWPGSSHCQGVAPDLDRMTLISEAHRIECKVRTEVMLDCVELQVETGEEKDHLIERESVLS